MKTIKVFARIILGLIVALGVLLDLYFLFLHDSRPFKIVQVVIDYLAPRNDALELACVLILMVCLPVSFALSFVGFVAFCLIAGWAGDLFVGGLKWIFTGKFSVADGPVQDLISKPLIK